MGAEGYRDVYVNDVGLAMLTSDGPYDFPEGTVIVKEQFKNKADWEAGKRAAHTISLKVADNPGTTSADWNWAAGYKGKAQENIEDPNWDFLSASAETVSGLVENIGFVYFPSPRGFDHINQVTVVDREGVIYRQVYGAAFELPWLIEPLKELVFNRPQPGSHLLSDLVDRVKLFCTVYDPNTGRYKFDYSLFVGIAVGAVIVLAVVIWLLLEIRRSRRSRKESDIA